MSEEEGVVVVKAVADVKGKIISIWLHFWLKRVAKRYPDFFMKMMSDLCDDDKSKEIMRLRYIFKLKFKTIPSYVFLEERAVYQRHQNIIDKIINL